MPKNTTAKTPLHRPAHLVRGLKQGQWQSGLPDSDTTVLVRTTDDDMPIAGAFHDGETWRDSTAEAIRAELIRGWMHLDRAAHLLDSLVIDE